MDDGGRNSGEMTMRGKGGGGGVGEELGVDGRLWERRHHSN